MVPAESVRASGKALFLWPAHSNAAMRFLVGEESAAKRITWRFFKRPLEGSEYAGLVGAPDDANVEVGVYRGALYIEFGDPTAAAYRGHFYLRQNTGRLILSNEGFHIHSAHLRGRGLGLCVFWRQVQNALKLGVCCIKTVAGRRADENGYYTWPRFGFDGLLSRRIRRRLPDDLHHARTALDLMASEPGRCWWRKHGETIRVLFDLSPASRSRATLRRYLQEKQLDWHATE